jgi:hypothetical protein
MSGNVQAVRERSDQGSAHGNGGRKYTRTFLVYMDDDWCAPYAAVIADGVPLLGDPYPVDAYAICSGVTCRQIGGEELAQYEIVCEYDSTKYYENDPFAEPPVIQWGQKSYQVIVQRDVITGDTIQASNGERFVPGVEQEVYNQTVTITRNESYYDPNYVSAFIGCINSDYAWVANLNIGPGQGLIRSITGSYKELGAGSYWVYPYWEVSYEIELQVSTFVTPLLDQGSFYFDLDLTSDTYGMFVPFYDDDEKKTLSDKPKNLDGAGSPLGAGLDPIVLTFNTYNSVAFTPLDLGYWL